jgi:hypothetical protein
LVQTEQVALVALRIDRHGDLRADGETVGCKPGSSGRSRTGEDRARGRLRRFENGGDLGVGGQFFSSANAPGN